MLAYRHNFSACSCNFYPMIFVTAGTQLPFDRFLSTVDEIAPCFPDTDFLVQVIDPKLPVSSPNIRMVSYLSSEEFKEAITTAELVISHAGIGTILSAAQVSKPLIVFPRMGKLKEHRNDHQVATCREMKKSFPLNIATDAEELKFLMHQHFEGALEPLPVISAYASENLLLSLREFISPVPALELL